MDVFFNSRGHHIATLVNRQLYNRGGQNIGQYLPQYGVFIDRQGRYLGEIVQLDRLMYNLLSPHCTAYFGDQQPYVGQIEPVGDVGWREPIDRARGYMDLTRSHLGELG